MDRLETAALARDILFGTSQIIGGMLGVVYLPGTNLKGGAVVLVVNGIERFWNAFDRLKRKNDLIAYETKKLVKQIKAASEDDEWDW